MANNLSYNIFKYLMRIILFAFSLSWYLYPSLHCEAIEKDQFEIELTVRKGDQESFNCKAFISFRQNKSDSLGVLLILPFSIQENTKIAREPMGRGVQYLVGTLSQSNMVIYLFPVDSNGIYTEFSIDNFKISKKRSEKYQSLVFELSFSYYDRITSFLPTLFVSRPSFSIFTIRFPDDNIIISDPELRLSSDKNSVKFTWDDIKQEQIIRLHFGTGSSQWFKLLLYLGLACVPFILLVKGKSKSNLIFHLVGSVVTFVVLFLIFFLFKNNLEKLQSQDMFMSLFIPALAASLVNSGRAAFQLHKLLKKRSAS